MCALSVVRVCLCVSQGLDVRAAANRSVAARRCAHQAARPASNNQPVRPWLYLLLRLLCLLLLVLMLALPPPCLACALVQELQGRIEDERRAMADEAAAHAEALARSREDAASAAGAAALARAEAEHAQVRGGAWVRVRAC